MKFRISLQFAMERRGPHPDPLHRHYPLRHKQTGELRERVDDEDLPNWERSTEVILEQRSEGYVVVVDAADYDEAEVKALEQLHGKGDRKQTLAQLRKLAHGDGERTKGDAPHLLEMGYSLVGGEATERTKLLTEDEARSMGLLSG